MSEIMVPIMIIVMIVVAIITWFAARNYERKQYDCKVGSAEEKSRENRRPPTRKKAVWRPF